MLKDMAPDTIFATGVSPDSPDGINMTNSGKILRWVAVRGGIYDWAIYCHFEDHSIDWIRNHGDKVHSMTTVEKLVPCDQEALEMYRH